MERSELYKKAKEMFKPGTKFMNNNLSVVGSEQITIVPDNAKFILDGTLTDKMHIYWEAYGCCFERTIYYDGKWAEIIK